MRREGTGDLSGNVADEAFCLKSALAVKNGVVTVWPNMNPTN